MKILFYLVIGIFSIIGIGTLISAAKFQFKNIGLTFGGLSYLGGALMAYIFSSWWLLLIGFGLAWLIRILGGDSSYK